MAHDDRVIPIEEALRRRRLREQAQEEAEAHEVRISDAMSHLLEGESGEEGPSAGDLRRIVEREFADEAEEGSDDAGRPRGSSGSPTGAKGGEPPGAGGAG
jgi:hypothetical protein